MSNNFETKSYKIYLFPQQEIRRIVQPPEPTWSSFLELVQTLFKTEQLNNENFLIEYRDEEGDNISVSSELEWQEANRIQLSSEVRKLFLFKQDTVAPCKLWQRKMAQLTSQTDLSQPCVTPPQTCRGLKLQQLLENHNSNNNAERAKESLLQEGNVVHLRCQSTGKTLRVMEDGTVNGNGQFGRKATFLVHTNNTISGSPQQQQQTIRLQNLANKKHWLRIVPGGGSLDGKGRGGPFTELKVFYHSCSVSFRANRNLKFGVGVLPDGSVKNPAATGLGPHARFFLSLAKEQNKKKDCANNKKQKPERKQV